MKSPEKSSASDVYKDEYAILERAERLLTAHDLAPEDLWQEFAALSRQYHQLLRTTVKMTRISDKTQKTLMTANEQIQQQQDALRETNAQLAHLNATLEQRVEEQTRVIRAQLEQLQEINLSYSRFVPFEFMEELGRESILDVKLGDHVHDEMTVLFSDIRSYTSLAESMSPQETFNFLNTYLRRIGPVIRDHHGFVNQYYGDGIMAIFPKTPEDAVQAGIDMLERVKQYNVTRRDKRREPIRIGIGVNTGMLMLGIIGDGRRADTGVVADTVNTAARMEGLSKYYGVSLIISDTTVTQIPEPQRYALRFLDLVQVKGKKNPMKIYEVFKADPQELFARKLRSLPEFEQGQRYYFARQFADAAKCFINVLTLMPEDLPTKHYLERSAKFMVEGVPDDWQGIQKMDVK